MAVPDALIGSIEVSPPVSIKGADPVALTVDTVSEFEIVTEPVTVVCATGARHTAEWTGMRVVDLLEAAKVPVDTTHVVVESIDEYRVAVPIGDAVKGVLAYLKDGVPIESEHAYANRFVCPNTDGARDIKGVSQIEHQTLDPAEDPESLENLFPEGERFTANRHEDDDQTQ